MVSIVGNVKPEDDLTHPLGPEQNFNESVYFNFFDRQKGMWAQRLVHSASKFKEE